MFNFDRFKKQKQGIKIHEDLQKGNMNDSNSPRLKWILQNHREAKNEYALTAVLKNNDIIKIIIDRTFIDENNVRWIIDYKITEDISLEAHREQLEKYGEVFKLKENPAKIMLGLYFPLTNDWIEWEYINTVNL